MTRSRGTLSPAMRSDSRMSWPGADGATLAFIGHPLGRRGEIQPEIERIEAAPAAGAGLPADASVDEQRNFLLRGAAVRTQRNIEPGQIVLAAAGALVGTPLRHDPQVADAVRRLLELRGLFGSSQHRFDPGKLRDS